MTDEETGFTFVDKRRTQPEETAEEVAAEQDEQPDELLLGESDPAPDVYDLIGYCVSLLATEAWQKLGLLADPKTGEAIADLLQAKAAIDAVTDLVGRLEAAPKEAVPDALRRDLRTLLNDLRLNYVSRRGDDTLSRN